MKNISILAGVMVVVRQIIFKMSCGFGFVQFTVVELALCLINF